MIFVNFKGAPLDLLIQDIKSVQDESSLKIIPVVNNLDIYPVRKTYNGELWIRYIETNTDFELKIDGTFLNHSDNRYQDWSKLSQAVSDCRNFGIKTMVFAGSREEIAKICEMKPDFVAYEPPELIGSQDKSVATESPDIIKKASEICKGFNIPLIVGAGIHSKEDVKKSLEMGAVGIAVSSFVVSSENPKKALMELVEGFEK